MKTILIIGEAKCGTSSLWDHICQHKLVARPDCKELHYFDRGAPTSPNHNASFVPDLLLYSLALRCDAYPYCDHEYWIDATPAYLRKRSIARLVKNVVEKPLPIAMVRNPVDRLYSNYWMRRRRGDERNFRQFAEDMIHKEPYPFDYARNLKRWDQLGLPVYVGFFEEMVGRTGEFMESLGKYLGIRLGSELGDPIIPDAPPGAQPQQHYPPMDDSDREMLEEYFAPQDRALRELVFRPLPWD